MTVFWMGYSVVVGVLTGLAALALEPPARGRRAPTRFLWLGALTVSSLLPAVAMLSPVRTAPGAGAAAVDLPLEVASLLNDFGREAPAVVRRLDTALGWTWLLASALMALGLVAGLAQLRSRARRWTRAHLDGDQVVLSDDFGPASLGLWTPVLVLPRWTLQLTPAALRLVVAHEREHGRARDAGLLLAGALAVVAAPWNPALWWQLRRLRGAVEMDCDERVLRGGASPAAYGALLLDLGSRGRLTPLMVPGIARPRSLLERRMTMIVRGAKRTGALGSAAAVCAAALLVVAACETPTPTAIEPLEDPADGTMEIAPLAEKLRPMAEDRAPQRRTDPGGPQIFLDGVRFEGDLGDLSLSSEDIERIEVVKGADGPGVIHITLKVRSGR